MGGFSPALAVPVFPEFPNIPGFPIWYIINKEA